MADTTIVIATRDRRDVLLATLARLRALPGDPPVVVVDNGSRDGTAAAVRGAHPAATVLALPANAGAHARTLGARHAVTPYVAFCDDDSWWASDALTRASAHFAAHPRVALLAARVLVGPQELLDRTCALMAASPLRGPRETLPGPPVLGFLACGAIVRRDAFLAVGGFPPRSGIGGEEQLLAVDLATAGWGLAYVDDVVAHHHPPASGPRPARARQTRRNDLRLAWLRRPLGVALGATLRALLDGEARAVAATCADLRRELPDRRPLPAGVEADVRRLDRALHHAGRTESSSSSPQTSSVRWTAGGPLMTENSRSFAPAKPCSSTRTRMPDESRNAT
jgi:GT2 family glycosyltransferase